MLDIGQQLGVLPGKVLAPQVENFTAFQHEEFSPVCRRRQKLLGLAPERANEFLRQALEETE